MGRPAPSHLGAAYPQGFTVHSERFSACTPSVDSLCIQGNSWKWNTPAGVPCLIIAPALPPLPPCLSCPPFIPSLEQTSCSHHRRLVLSFRQDGSFEPFRVSLQNVFQSSSLESILKAALLYEIALQSLFQCLTVSLQSVYLSLWVCRHLSQSRFLI